MVASAVFRWKSKEETERANARAAIQRGVYFASVTEG
jgi:hypothetical protein